MANAPFDASKHLVCSEPNVWVFDDLLSQAFLDHIDSLFASGITHEFKQVEGGKNRNSRSVQLDLDDTSKELTDVIRSVAQIKEVEPCQKFLISDVTGDIQDPHTDHISLKDLELRYDKLSFLDLCKQSTSPWNQSKIVPTFSIVVYFNNAGGIRFPKSPSLKDELIPGKRGRIVMFQNFNDSERPATDPMSEHYGIYFDEIPRRLMTMGILANETPSLSAESGKLTDGLIYCAGVRDEGIRHDWMPTHHSDPEPRPATPKPPPKKDLILSLDAVLEGTEWVITVRTMAGSEKCVLCAQPGYNVGWLVTAVKAMVDSKDEFNVELVLPDGRVVIKGNVDASIQHLFVTTTCMSSVLALPPDDTTKAKQIFESWDVDGSGTLALDELAAALRHLDPSLTDEQLFAAFEKMDTNSDGAVEWVEFLEFVYSDASLVS